GGFEVFSGAVVVAEEQVAGAGHPSVVGGGVQLDRRVGGRDLRERRFGVAEGLFAVVSLLLHGVGFGGVEGGEPGEDVAAAAGCGCLSGEVKPGGGVFLAVECHHRQPQQRPCL